MGCENYNLYSECNAVKCNRNSSLFRSGLHVMPLSEEKACDMEKCRYIRNNSIENDFVAKLLNSKMKST
ncbi:hypothetical protein SADUNF_Sadunf10G0138100 [Salix dunnii]|uniref:Uncharacterized protein n=1 Tax=Salix dunnii TaxID=1413687 RepID=A0A835JTV1_9ROSI|nr:hypothetical protein SADUNF_Sadunf10G0138100 [Salix dunnii]